MFPLRKINISSTDCYAYVENDPVNWIDPEGLAAYKSTEGHFILGGGLLEIECCTEDGKGLKHLYGKICLGVAFEVSGGVGKAFNSDNKSCSNPAKNLLGSELGGSYGVGAEGSVTVDTGGSGISGFGGFGVGGGKVGIGAKAASCYYRLINTIPSDQKYKCD